MLCLMKTVRELLEEYAVNVEANLPRPSAAWFKQQLESLDTTAHRPAKTADSGWWHQLLSRIPALFGEPGYADGKMVIARERPYGMVPAIALRPADLPGGFEETEV